MRQILSSWLLVGLLCSAGACQSATADEQAFTRLNAIGRYLGVGYSHHGYHSGPAGRLQVVQQNHPASAYPSTHRASPYLPVEVAHRPQRLVNGYSMPPGPTLAPQLTSPSGPTLSTDSSSRDKLPVAPPKASATPPDNLLDDLDDAELLDNQLPDGSDPDRLLDDEDGLQAGARHRQPSQPPRFATPGIQSNIHRYTPFR